MPKPYVEYDPKVHGELFRISRYRGICRWCEQAYYPGTKVNWNPRVKNTCCHAGCYKAYGSPAGREEDQQDITPTNPPKFVPNPNPEPKPSSGLPQAILDAIEPYLKDKLHGLVSAEQVQKILDQILETKILKTVTTVTIERETDLGLIEIEDLGLQHKQFELLLNCLKARDPDGYRLNMMLVGPAGTGKTTAARNVARALGLRFAFSGAVDTKYDYLGYTDLNGKLVRTQFREIWEHGGVFLQDELDGSNANALLPWNTGLANHVMAFPDGVVEQNKDCIIICAMNTWGLGATNDYVGRTKLDAATLNRYVPLKWDNDEALETAMSNHNEWVTRVQKVRSTVKTKGYRGIMITPRQSIYGACLLHAGIPQHVIEEMLLRQSMTDEQWNSVRS